MDFGFYYRPDVNRMLFHYVPDTGARRRAATTRSSARAGSPATSASPRARSRSGSTSAPYRSFPDTCDWSWTETQPVGFTRTYFGTLGLRRLAALQRHAGHAELGRQHVRGADAVAVRARGALGARGAGAPTTRSRSRAQIHHGLVEAGYGYWGFSPANIPEGGYATYGVDGIGSDSDGYPSNNDATLIDHGWPGCRDRPALPDPPPSAYTNGVVTPHAAFLALRYAPRETLANLARLERDFDIYTRWGFRDSVNVDTGVVSDSYLSLDQGMIMAAIGNALGHDVLRRRVRDA